MINNASPDRGSMKRLQSTLNNEEPKKAASIDLRRIPGVDVLADHALVAYLKVVAEINRNKSVLKYRHEPRLTDNGHHEFKVRMGFGLHAGWAIEGAVGSLQKVDATYLSPHVNMAARLETSSRQYGVPLLASQDFFDLLSNTAQARCRRLDVVTVKGSEVPIGIYTYDAFQDQEFREDKRKRRPSTDGKAKGDRNSFSTPATQNNEKANNNESPQRRPSVNNGVEPNGKPAQFMTPQDETTAVYEKDCDLLALRAHVTVEFLDVFKEGVSLYLSGEWKGAKTLLEKADTMMRDAVPALGGDGPSRTLLNYMGEREFEAPKTWKGYRPLTAK